MSKTQYRDSQRDTVHEYLRQIGSFRLLERHEEVELGNTVQRWQKSLVDWNKVQGPKPSPVVIRAGLRAREKMVQHNLKLVASIAKKYTNRGIDLLELVQEGSIGLQRGAEKFDPAKGYRFSTYASWWIRQAITRAVGDLSHTIRLPTHIIEKINRIRKMSREAQQHGQALSIEELAIRCNYSVEMVEKALAALHTADTISTNSSILNSDGDKELGDTISDDLDLIGEYTAQSMIESVRAAIEASNLTGREQSIIKLRFGINTDHAHTLEEVAGALGLGLSRERVRQMESRAMRKLKHYKSPLHQIRDMVS